MKLPEGFEATRWGGSRVLSRRTGDNGLQALTKEIIMEAGCSMSYQMHRLREHRMLWTERYNTSLCHIPYSLSLNGTVWSIRYSLS